MRMQIVMLLAPYPGYRVETMFPRFCRGKVEGIAWHASAPIRRLNEKDKMDVERKI